jgi:hypothetical protein
MANLNGPLKSQQVERTATAPASSCAATTLTQCRAMSRSLAMSSFIKRIDRPTKGERRLFFGGSTA